jgi:glycerophosphoryl diester phosphodiesterase
MAPTSSPGRFPFLAGPRPIAYAHQGGGKEHPENSWVAYRYAIDELGYTHLETDVVVTSDGVVFHLHDATLDRTTTLTGPALSHTWDEVSRCVVRGTNEAPPLFEDVLAHWPELFINIEPKTDEVVEPLLALIRKHGATARVCIGSFHGDRIVLARRALGASLCTSTGRFTTLRLVVGSWLPLPLGKLIARTGAACYQIPVKQWFITVTSRRSIRLAKAMGLEVHCWTIDEAAEMDRLLDLGVEGIMTDKPSVLKGVLVRRGSWHGRS